MAFQSLPVTLSQDSLELLVANLWTDSTPEEIQTIVAVGMAESGGVLNAIHDNAESGHQERGSIYQWDDGWPQINSVHGYDRTKLAANPEYAAIAALAVLDKQGFRAWAAYKAGNHEKYMGELSDPMIGATIQTLLEDGENGGTNPPSQKVSVRVVPLRKRFLMDRYYVEVVKDSE